LLMPTTRTITYEPHFLQSLDPVFGMILHKFWMHHSL